MGEQGAPVNTLRSDVDGYGFKREDDFDFTTFDSFMSEYLSVLARRASKWQTLISRKPHLKKSPKVKRFCRKGIPNEQRTKVWMMISGAEERMKMNTKTYKILVQAQKDESVMETINLDLHRTFPENIYFRTTDGLRKSLKNVLAAIAHQNPARGYCQGLNYVAGVLLLVTKDEEKTFWLLDTLMNSLLPDFYAPNMTAVKVEQEVLGEIIKWKSPDLHKHFEDLDTPWSLIGTKWFLCLFADVMPVETVLRIWDCLFYEGHKILLRVSAMLIIQNKEELLLCDSFTMIVEELQKLVKSPKTVKCHSFMQSCFQELGSFPSARISKIRGECADRVEGY